MFQGTVKQFAQKLDIDYLTASAILKAAVKTGQGEEIGTRRTSLSGKGKPATVYQIMNVISFNLDSSQPETAT